MIAAKCMFVGKKSATQLSTNMSDEKKQTWEFPDLPAIDLSGCCEDINPIDQIKFMSREEAIATYGVLPIPCTINDVPHEVIMITERGDVIGLPINKPDAQCH